jgi:hypothetical protein
MERAHTTTPTSYYRYISAARSGRFAPAFAPGRPPSARKLGRAIRGGSKVAAVARHEDGVVIGPCIYRGTVAQRRNSWPNSPAAACPRTAGVLLASGRRDQVLAPVERSRGDDQIDPDTSH